MSLIRQIWLLLLGVVLLSLVGSAAVSAGSIRYVLQTQLQLKNSDNALSLALAMSQQRGDEQLMELLIAAQFDSGYYESLQWRKADGKVGFERHAAPAPSIAPRWFVALTPITVQPGVAQVSNGWKAVGAIEVSSQSAYVHDELWRSTMRTAGLLAVVGLVAGVLALLVMRRIRKPLDNAVEQAKSLVEGSFMMIEESHVPELQRLTRAMNTMVARMKGMFEAQAAQLEALRVQAHCDPLTGLSHRKHFLAQFESALEREDGPAEAGLVLLRLRDLQGLNLRLGRPTADRTLMAVANAVKAYPERVQGCVAGRLNGADFALWLPAPEVAIETARSLAEALRVSLPAFGPHIHVSFGAVEMSRSRASGAWFGEADAALARAEALGPFAVEMAAPATPDVPLQGERVWRQQITDAIKERRTRLVQYPVIDRGNQVQHLECPLQMQLDSHGDFEPAMRWLPLAVRSRLTADVDTHAVALALEAISRDGQQRCVNISPMSLLDTGFTARLRDLVFQSPQAARKLGMEVAETAAINSFDLLYEMGRQLRPLGVLIGIEHAGAGLSQVERLYQAGLDYVKLDASVVQGVAGDAARAAFVRGMVIMLRSLALKVYAEGVTDPMDVQALWDCEVDGVTGPWASAQIGGAGRVAK
ncbi:MAG: EAL domain-containing protein [Burkholderiaceae bacterium]|nr:EAL domain-containing protein [Burkholderiaceae bacterium]